MVFRVEGGFFSSQRRILIQHGKNSFVHFFDLPRYADRQGPARMLRFLGRRA